MAFLLCMIPSIVLADKNDFVVNKSYDASNIKNIIVMYAIPQPAQQNVSVQQIPPKLITEIKNDFAKDKNIKITMFDDLVSRINSENNINYTELNKTDPQKANAILANYLKQFDACFTVYILAYEIDSIYVPEYTHDVQEWVDTDMTQYDTTTDKWVPVKWYETVTVTDPAYYYNDANTALLMTLTDINTKQIIFSRQESRTHTPRGIWNEDPISPAKRILSDYINDTLKMIKNNDVHK